MTKVTDRKFLKQRYSLGNIGGERSGTRSSKMEGKGQSSKGFLHRGRQGRR